MDDYGSAYVHGNAVDGNPRVTADNWDGGVQPEPLGNGATVLAGLRSDQPYPHAWLDPVLAAAIAGLVGIPTLRLKGYYLAMATLGINEIVHRPDATPAAITAPAANAASASASAAAASYRDIVRSYGPAVVGVTAQGTHRAGGSPMPDFSDDPYFQFFRGLPNFRGQPPGGTPFRGQGSGFIISADGLILTNAHVVREAKEVTVKLSDRREFRARVLGLDPATDVAVLKVDARDLPAVALGSDREAQVGDPVLAIGAPFGFEQSATQGIISAKGRALPGDAFVPFIQTDAAVNPGNSGGPLFDAAGRVIGINAQIYSQNGGFQGLAFAIPIDVALRVKDQIVAHGKVEHAPSDGSLIDLERLPAPDWDSEPLRRFRRKLRNPKFRRGPTANLLLSRGCAYRCLFCVPISISCSGLKPSILAA